jgi:hypothetical protein
MKRKELERNSQTPSNESSESPHYCQATYVIRHICEGLKACQKCVGHPSASTNVSSLHSGDGEQCSEDSSRLEEQHLLENVVLFYDHRGTNASIKNLSTAPRQHRQSMRGRGSSSLARAHHAPMEYHRRHSPRVYGALHH